MAAKNIFHWDSVSAGIPGIWSQLWSRWEFKTIPWEPDVPCRSSLYAWDNNWAPLTTHALSEQVFLPLTLFQLPLSLATWVLKFPSRTMEFPVQAPLNDPPKDSRKGYNTLTCCLMYSCKTLVRTCRHYPKVKGRNPLVQQGKFQHNGPDVTFNVTSDWSAKAPVFDNHVISITLDLLSPPLGGGPMGRKGRSSGDCRCWAYPLENLYLYPWQDKKM